MSVRLQERYAAHVERRPDALAVVDDRARRLSNRELWAAAGETAEMLAADGLGPGDVILLFLPNRVDWMVLFLAALRLRAVPATAPGTMDEASLRHAAELVHARVIAAPVDYRRDAAGLASEVVSSASHRSALLLSTSDGGWMWGVRSRAGDGEAPPLSGVDHLMFTSSTTGRPKATMHDDPTLELDNRGLAERYGLTSETPIFMPSPLGHSIGTCHGARLSLYLGAPLVLQDVWDPELALRLADEERCVFTAAATPFLKDLIEESWAGSKLASVRVFLCGGAPVPPSLIEQAAGALPSTFVTNLWGMTEGGMACCPLDAPREKVIATSGTPIPGCELSVIDEEARVLRPGSEGELIVGGEDIILGYLGEPELFEAMRLPDGSIRSGDLARLDEEGYLTVTGRIKDLIIRGGVNIPPAPIEAALSTHPNVRRVAVVGLPDARLGERICAVIVAKGEPPDLPSLLAWAERAGLPKRSWPEAVVVVDEMPTTPAGKVKKQELKELLHG